MTIPPGQLVESVFAELEKDPFAFDFFQALRRIQSIVPDYPRIGASRSPAEDPVRFGQAASLAFAPSTLAGFDRDDSGKPQLLVNFFGLTGPNGPLPLILTEWVREREHSAADPTLLQFLNIFHHRLLSFFFRAWACNQKTADLDRPDQQRFPLYFGSLFGLGMDSLRDRDSVPDWAKLFFSGRLSSPTKNAEGLAAIIREYFEIRTQIEEFVGQWLVLPEDVLCQLGRSSESGSLGKSIILGSRVWDCQLKFRVRLGPMSLERFLRMLPPGEAFPRLKAWVLNYVGEEFFWDLQLVLAADEVPSVRLGSSGLLGWTTWLKSRPMERDADDLILTGL